MPEFRCEIVGSDGQIEERYETGESAEDVRVKLEQAGLRVRSVQPVSKPEPTPAGRPLSAEELTILNRQLIALARTGAPLVGGLKALAADLRRGRLHDTVQSLIQEMEAGMSLSEALGRHRGQFPPFYEAMMEAAVASGNLAGVMEMLSHLVTSASVLRKRIVTAAAYPILVLSTLVVMVVLYLVFLFPKVMSALADFSDFASFGERAVASPQTRFIIIQVLGLVPAAIVLLALLLLLMVRIAPGGRHNLMAVSRRFPLYGPVVHAERMFLVCRTLSVLLKARVPMRESLNLLGQVLSGSAEQEAFKQVAALVEGGRRFSEALSTEKIFPVPMVWMVSVAESRGELDEGLHEIGEHYRDEAEHRAGLLMAAAPAILVPMAGLMVLGAALPVFSMLLQLINLMTSI